MERGVKLAVVVAAVVCLVAGLAWDRVVRTVVADGDLGVTADGETAHGTDDADEPRDEPGCRMEFTFVGSVTETPEPPDAAAGRAAERGTGAGNGSPSARNGHGNGNGNGSESQLVSAAAISPAAGSAASHPPAKPREQLYTVRNGDRLGSISRKFFGTERYWREIMTYNNIRDPRALRPNQVLKIPPIETASGSNRPASRD